MSDRRIVLDCTSGDGSVFTASTANQNEETALKFTIDGGGADRVTVYVDREDVQDLIDFLTRENYRYRNEWPYTEEDETDDVEEPF
jgi:mevalonate pyrophosphate decarboxylase